MTRFTSMLKAQRFSLILLGSIVLGSAVGAWLGPDAERLKPLGTVLLNMLFVTAVPLVFFTIASSVANIASTKRLMKILGWMMLVFTATGVVAAVLMIVGVQWYNPFAPVGPAPAVEITQLSAANQIVNALTVPDFVNLLSRQNLLALIVFAVLTGLATSSIGEKGKTFAAFLRSGNEVFLKVISYIMLYAPVGLAACFAALVGKFGPTLLTDYGRAMLLYYPLCIGYFFVAFTLYAYLAGSGRGVKAFWSNIGPAALTAAGTSSSFATIPLNLQAADRVGVPRDISELVIPLGAQVHMDGSVLSAVLKIAFLFGLYHIPFEGAETIVKVIAVALLSGVVMSGIPGGGFTGEIIIVVMYGFPQEALVYISTIGNLVDPPATMVNAIGDNVASMMVARILGGRKWMDRPTFSREPRASALSEEVSV
jgi:Na+/H+-dicarboxylate symporter